MRTSSRARAGGGGVGVGGVGVQGRALIAALLLELRCWRFIVCAASWEIQVRRGCAPNARRARSQLSAASAC